jgi:CheY-like chemotaxis protein
MPAKTAQQAEMTEVRESAPALRGKRVLVAEDNRVNIAVVERLLRRLACECTTATDGASAARMAVSGRFDAILMDLQMPQADGFEATRTIRASGVDAPIIALTASAVDGERERCLAAGMNDYLSKPIDRKRLEAVLVRWTINAPAGRH